MSNPTNVADLVDLSNEDVRTLYDIVSAAEQSRLPPFRALFGAYEDVLAKRGIAKETDQVYLRFLLRMGEERKDSQSLFDQFETLLSKLGIQVAFDGEGQEAEDTASLASSRRDAESPSIKRLQTQSFRPARRASFDSGLDDKYDTRTSLERLDIISPRPRSVDSQLRKGIAMSRSLASHQTVKSALRPPSTTERGSTRGRLGSQDYQIVNQPTRRPSVSTSENLRENISQITSEESGSESEYEDQSSVNESPAPTLQEALSVTVPPEIPAPSSAQRESHVKTLRFHHVAAKAVSLFRHWRSVAEASRNQHVVLHQTATLRDATTLKRQAFDKWRIAVDEERQIRETEKFYLNLETRATKARSLFLLTKAFTHWAQCSSEETLRKTAAREYILRATYFNAWRDITVVNELKVRRQRLSKIMKVWKHKTSQAMDLDERAIEFQVLQGTVQAYRSWFWHFCERRAPAWYASKLERKMFLRWLAASRAARIRHHWADEFRNLELCRSSIANWVDRSGSVQDNISKAIGFRRHSLLAPIVDALQRDLRLAPLQTQLRRRIDLRVARSALDQWVSRISIINQAKRINDLRVLRNAWTTWNDFLRSSALSRSIDERMKMQALYQWVLAERLALCQRIRRQRLLSSILETWHQRTNVLCSTLGKACHLAQLASENRALSCAVRRWANLADVERREGLRAQQFRDLHLTADALKSWKSRSQHVQATQIWSKDARFYVLTTGAIKKWSAACAESKKSKRRNAYSTIRRRLKMSMARDVLIKWRNAAVERRHLRVRGDEILRQRVQHTAMVLLSEWHARTMTTQEDIARASAFHEAKATQNFWLLILSRVRVIEESEARAQSFSLESRQAVAASCLRKLSWQVFQVKRLHESGESLNKRNKRKHFKSMLRHWSESVLARRSAGNDDGTEIEGEQYSTASLGRPMRALHPLPRTHQWTPLHDRALVTQGPVPLASRSIHEGASSNIALATPAYLRTPSRHRSNPSTSRAVAQTQPLRPISYSSRNSPTSWTAHLPRLTKPANPSSGVIDASVASPATPAPSQPQGDLQTQSQTSTPRITPFMYRLRAQYPTPGTAGPLSRPITREGSWKVESVGVGSALRRVWDTDNSSEVDDNGRRSDVAGATPRGGGGDGDDEGLA